MARKDCLRSVYRNLWRNYYYGKIKEATLMSYDLAYISFAVYTNSLCPEEVKSEIISICNSRIKGLLGFKAGEKEYGLE